MSKKGPIAVGNGPLAVALLKALGLEDRRVTPIEFRVATNEIVTLKVEEIVSVDAVTGVIKALTEYALVSKDRPDDATTLADKAVQKASLAP